MSDYDKPRPDPQASSEDYRRAWMDGYQSRVQEEVRDYLRQIEVGRQVYDRTIRGLMNLPTIEELRAAREGTLREAHAAELHAGRPAFGCPVCEEAAAAARRALVPPACNEHGQPMVRGVDDDWHCVCTRVSATSDRHHIGDYGAPLIDGTGITSTMIDLFGPRGASCPINGAGDPYAGALYPGAPVVESVRFRVDRSGCPNESSAECCSEVGHCVMLRRAAAGDA